MQVVWPVCSHVSARVVTSAAVMVGLQNNSARRRNQQRNWAGNADQHATFRLQKAHHSLGYATGRSAIPTVPVALAERSFEPGSKLLVRE